VRGQALNDAGGRDVEADALRHGQELRRRHGRVLRVCWARGGRGDADDESGRKIAIVFFLRLPRI
jgi:hypothetical protein